MRSIPALASLTLTLSLTALAACGTDPPAAGDDDQQTGPTWYQDVAPLMSSKCMGCHQDGGIAPFSLTTYADAKVNAQNALTRIDTGEMPPWNASSETDCAPSRSWVDDPSLTAADKQLIHDWFDNGMLEGTEATIPPPASTDLADASMTLMPVQPFTTAGTNDQFICTILDPNITDNVAWMTGLQVRPGNPAVVHHAVISEVRPGPQLDALLQAHPDPGVPFDCGAGTPADFIMAIWTPGNQPMETPTELAVPILKGARVVMQIHYHPANITNDPDTTKVDIRLSNVWPQKMYFVAAFGNASNAPNLLPDPDDFTVNPEFTIPANKADHVENMTFTMPDLSSLGPDVRIYSANPHMHLTGTHISGKLTRATHSADEPDTECLANGGWNFDWQRTYTYDSPLDKLPSIHQGDTLSINCHWDNTVENPFVQRMMHDAGLGAPIDIHLGEMTTNEMCLEIFGVSVNAPAQPASKKTEIMIPSVGLNMSAL